MNDLKAQAYDIIGYIEGHTRAINELRQKLAQINSDIQKLHEESIPPLKVEPESAEVPNG